MGKRFFMRKQRSLPHGNTERQPAAVGDMHMLVMMTFLFGSYHLVDIILEILPSVGFSALFRDCGVHWLRAWIPFVRVYYLGKCADREPEGKTTAVMDVIANTLFLANFFVRTNSLFYFLLTGLSVSAAMIAFVYRLRIYSGLCEIFEQSKVWMFLWIICPCVPALWWGLSAKINPAYTVRELEAEDEARFSGTFATELKNGLTVNLEDRRYRHLFETKYLLKDIHMVIQPGHMVLLLGGSGAGKTTLINAINGYEKANASVLLNGKNIYKEYKQIQYEIGYVPQKDLMRDHDTVSRTLGDAAALRMPLDADAGERRVLVKEVLGIFGLEPVRNQLVSKLSGGQRKRLSIAMEYIANPSLFILDEPDSGLDGVMARELMERLRGIADHGKIVIVITHTPDRVIDLFDDVIVLAKDRKLVGRLAFYGSVEEAMSFFGKDRMEQIVMSINREEEGGEGRADEFVEKYVEIQQA